MGWSPYRDVPLNQLVFRERPSPQRVGAVGLCIKIPEYKIKERLKIRQYSRSSGKRYEWVVDSDCLGFTTGRGHPVYRFKRYRGRVSEPDMFLPGVEDRKCMQEFEIKRITPQAKDADIKFELNKCVPKTTNVYTVMKNRTTKIFYVCKSTSITKEMERLWDKIQLDRETTKSYANVAVNAGKGRRLIERRLREEA